MSDWLLYAGLVSALAIGFFLGAYQSRKQRSDSSYSSAVDQHYVKGLNFILNEQPDAAIDTFIQALEVNSETLETHLALGKLLRRRGEVDRAVRIHQNLLARPSLTTQQIQQVQYELATDFVKSGLFDRAEGLLTTLVTQEGPYKTLGLKRLLEIYRDEKEWLQGLDILQELSGSRLSRSYEEWAPIRAHFCCELAEEHMLLKHYEDAQRWLKQALSYDRQSVRANLLLGRLEIAAGSLPKGINILQKLVMAHVDYVPEVLPYLQQAYTQRDQLGHYYQFLRSLSQHTQDPSVLVALSELIAKKQGTLAAAQYVADEVVKTPSGIGLHRLLEYYLSFTEGNTHEYLSSLSTVMEKVIANNTDYQCRHCGFKGKQLHWLCPSCKKWGSLRPKRDVANNV